MLNITLPTAGERPLSFYLAMEEYVAAAFRSGFFVWNVAPTVIIGRHQDLAAEVNLPYCREHGIDIVRRKSGGGCVYADRGNLMVSYITPEGNVDAVFSEYLEHLASFLRSLGFDAVRTEHNDVVVGGCKVSGNACLVRSGASIVHGTLLHSVDLDAMQRSITPSAEKLAKHAVASVRARVTNLTDIGLRLTVQELADAITAEFCTGRRELSPSELEAVEDIQKSYGNPDFIHYL